MADATGSGLPSALLERVDEGGVNRVLRAWDRLDLPDRLPESGRLGEDLVDRARVALGAVVLLALRDTPERYVFHRRLDVSSRLAEVTVDVGECFVRVRPDQLYRVVVGGNEGHYLVAVLFDEARREGDVVGDDRRVLLRRHEDMPVRVRLRPRQPRLPRDGDLHASGREGSACV